MNATQRIGLSAVVMALLTTHFVMLSKNLLYTAVTREKRLVVLVAAPRATRLALAADRQDERRTRLTARLQERCTVDGCQKTHKAKGTC